MPGLLESCRTLFDTDDLYSVLGVGKDAPQSEVKRGYHKLSLKVHPDRVSEDEKESATIKFQTLGKVYSILSDKDKRAVYDESGEIEEDDEISQDRDWTEYWRLLYKKISVDDILAFEKNYKGSDEELEDLKSAYCDYEGDMDQILENVLCATVDDEERFREILTGLIEAEEIPSFKAFVKEKKAKKEKRKKKAQSEAAEAEELATELGINGAESLKNLIMKRNESRGKEADSFFAHLEAKYAKPAKSKKGKKAK